MRATKKPKDRVYDQLIAVVAQPKKSQKAGLRQKNMSCLDHQKSCAINNT